MPVSRPYTRPVPNCKMSPMDEKLDIREKGGIRNGAPQVSDRRLFMQFLAFGDAEDTASLVRALEAAHLPAVLYADANDPHGVGLLTWSDAPDFFVTSGAVMPSATSRISRTGCSKNQNAPSPTARPHGQFGTPCAGRAHLTRCRRRSRRPSCASTARSATHSARPASRPMSGSPASVWTRTIMTS